MWPITVSVAPEITALNADEVRVKQILVNLLSNAVKVTKAKGNIAVEVAIPKAHAVPSRSPCAMTGRGLMRPSRRNC